MSVLKEYAMKQHLLGMALLAVSASAWSLSCTPKPAFEVLHTGNVYVDSVFWLQSSVPESQAPISVADLQLQQDGKAVAALQANPQKIAGYTGFQVQPQVTSRWGLPSGVERQKRDSYAFLSDLANRFTVETKIVTSPDLAWRKPPKLIKVGHHSGTWGDSGNVLWSLQTTRPLQDYLVVIQLAPSVTWKMPKPSS
jgi:hypothetical protein